MMEIIIEHAIAAVVGVLATWIVAQLAIKLPGILSAALIYIQSKVEEARSHFTQSQLMMFDALVYQSIQAVEQKTKIGEIISTTGAEKKQQALHFIQEECDRLGIPFDLIAADRKIEAAISQGIQTSHVLSSLPVVTPDTPPAPPAEETLPEPPAEVVVVPV